MFGLKAVVLVILLFVSCNTAQTNSLKEIVEVRNITSCANFFKPCSCTTDANGRNSVTCQYLTPIDIYDAFHKEEVNATDIYSFTYLARNISEVDLPTDLLGEHKITGLLTVKWWSYNQNSVLKIADNAFNSSGDSLRSLDIQGFNARLLDWKFLNSFRNLSTLTIYDMTNMESFSTFSALTSPLRTITIESCKGLTDFPEMPPSLTRLDIAENNLDDKAASLILRKLFVVNETLTELDISNQPLTSIPRELTSFSNLKFVTLKWTNITYIPAASFVSPFFFQGLDLEQSNITFLEPAAFQGYYGGVLVNMKRNLFIHFEEPVFRNMLVDMYCQRSGQLDLEYSNITCDCSLAWLVRDSRHLLPYIWRGRCSNSTLFNKLDPAGFANCEATANVTICQDVPTTTPRPTTPSTTTSMSTSTITTASTTEERISSFSAGSSSTSTPVTMSSTAAMSRATTVSTEAVISTQPVITSTVTNRLASTTAGSTCYLYKSSVAVQISLLIAGLLHMKANL